MAKPEFTKYIDDLAMQAAAMSPLWLAKSDARGREAEAARDLDAQLAEEGKPEAARPKIIDGKLAK
ncbi:MAG: hypothetical protein U0263_35685 [Polyangiaceae bacterium]